MVFATCLLLVVVVAAHMYRANSPTRSSALYVCCSSSVFYLMFLTFFLPALRMPSVNEEKKQTNSQQTLADANSSVAGKNHCNLQ